MDRHGVNELDSTEQADKQIPRFEIAHLEMWIGINLRHFVHVERLQFRAEPPVSDTGGLNFLTDEPADQNGGNRV